MHLLSLAVLGCATEPADTAAPDDTAGDTADSAVNTPPVVVFAEPAGALYATGEPIPFDAQLTDAEDDPARLDVTWTGADGTVYTIDNTPVPAGHLLGSLTLEVEGEYTITLAATDPAGNVGTASVSFSVLTPDALPECTILNPEAGDVVAERASVLLAGEVDDAETPAAELAVEWRSDVDGLLGDSVAVGEGTVSLLVNDLSVGEHTLALQVTDSAGGVCTDTIDVRVNGTPDVDIDTPVKNDVFNEGETVSFTGTVADDRQGPTELSVVWFDDTESEVLDSHRADATGAVAFSTAALAPGEHKVLLGAEDDDGAQGWDSVTITINDLPSAPGVVITGTDELVASIDVASGDLEGDPISYSYAWTQNGIPYPAVDATIPATATTSGEVWAVTVTPNDGYGDGEAGVASTTIP